MRRFSRRVIFRLVSRGRIAFLLLHRDPGERAFGRLQPAAPL